MKYWFTIIAIIQFVFPVTVAQNDVYVPRNIMDAVKKGTRTLTGHPGEKYWQNSSDYKIKATIQPEEKILEGWEKIVYYNNSPDTLKQIVLRLYQNLQKPNAKRDLPFPNETITEGMKVTSLIIGDKSYDISDNVAVREYGTNLFIKLIDPIAPGAQAVLETEWNFEIPASAWRLGYFDTTSAFVAYWYPQIAVYDDIDGWDEIIYSGIAEMYNDFNNYDVEITLPAGFNLWATGRVQNPEEIYSDEILSRYNRALVSDDVVNIITKADYENGKVFRTNNAVTFKYSANNVPDFAFGFSNNYLWDGVSLESKNGDRIYIASAYKESSQDFYEVADISRKVLIYFSEKIPGIPYPYESAVTYNGAGGMEFPMICNNGSFNREGMVGVTSHELAHQYAPFALGINERKYAWMDEGWAVMLPFDFQEQYDNQRRYQSVRAYESVAGTESDIPPIFLTYHIQFPQSRNSSYVRPGLAYMFLRDMLGDDMFRNAFGEFYERWAGKHPTPYDFFNTFNDAAGKNLSWFWNPWFTEWGYPDLALKEYSFSELSSIGRVLSVKVHKNGNVPVPVNLDIKLKDGSVINYYKAADIWADGNTTHIAEVEISSDVVSIELGSQVIPDVNKENNVLIIDRN